MNKSKIVHEAAAFQDAQEDPKSRSRNLAPYTTKGYFIGTPLKGSAFWIL